MSDRHLGSLNASRLRVLHRAAVCASFTSLAKVPIRRSNSTRSSTAKLLHRVASIASLTPASSVLSENVCPVWQRKRTFRPSSDLNQKRRGTPGRCSPRHLAERHARRRDHRPLQRTGSRRPRSRPVAQLRIPLHAGNRQQLVKVDAALPIGANKSIASARGCSLARAVLHVDAAVDSSELSGAAEQG